MTPNIRFAGLVLIALFAWASFSPRAALAQGGPPQAKVTAVPNTDRFAAGGRHVVAVVLDIPAPFHAQSANPTSPDYIPTALLPAPVAASDVKLGNPVYPPGKVKDFPALGGKLSVYEGRVVLYLPVTIDPSAKPGEKVTIAGKVRAQLCDDQNCFPPEETAFSLTVELADASATLKPADESLFKDFDWSAFGKDAPASQPSGAAAPVGPSTPKGPTVSLFGRTLALDAWYVSFPLAIVVGVLFNVMPCVLPVLPLKALSFYEAGKHSRARSVFLGAVFSAGMVTLFALLGVLISAFSFTWGQQFQYGWFVWGVSLVLIAFAASMWGLFTVPLPRFVYSVDPRADTVPGNLLFGAFTAVLATPCIAPMFAPLTVWAASQTPLVGTLLFTAVGCGMALPYLVLSGFPEVARKLPRSGPASEIMKQTLGFFILGTAVWLLGQRLLPGNQSLYLVAVVVLAAGVFVVARTASLVGGRRPITVAASFAVVFTASTFALAAKANEKPVIWEPYSDARLAELRAQGRPVVVKFTANWCANCQVVEHTVYPQAAVKKSLAARDAALLKVDLTASGAPGSELLRQLSPAGGIPLTAVYVPGAANPQLLPGLYSADDLLAAVGDR